MTIRDKNAKLRRLDGVNVFVVLEDTVEGGRIIPAGSVVIGRGGRGRRDIYVSIYDAGRSRREVADSYAVSPERGEDADLRRSRRDLKGLRGQLDASADAAGAAQGLTQAATWLKRKRNRHKVEAREKAKAGPVLTPKNQVLNRAATAARVTAIDRRLARRQREIVFLQRHNTAMEQALVVEFKRSLNVIRRAAREIGGVIKHAFFRTGKTTSTQQRGLAARLQLVTDQLETLVTAPFNGFAREMRERVSHAAKAVAQGHAAETKARLDEALIVVDRVLLQAGIESAVTIAATALKRPLAAAALEGLRRRLAEAINFCQASTIRRSFRRAIAGLTACGQLLDACRLELEAGRTDVAVAQLEAFKNALKELSRRLSARQSN